jgi:Fis family transcriptional regulator, factor for inversion stimulation protein
MIEQPPVNAAQAAPQLSDSLAPASPTLRECVNQVMQKYLAQVEDELISDLYQMVLSEVEPPLLEAVMHYTRSNQTKASQMLGLNRGTLRKKLKQYEML